MKREEECFPSPLLFYSLQNQSDWEFAKEIDYFTIIDTFFLIVRSPPSAVDGGFQICFYIQADDDEEEKRGREKIAFHHFRSQWHLSFSYRIRL